MIDYKTRLKQRMILPPGRLIFVIMGLAFILRISAIFILQYPEDTANAWRATNNIVENLIAGKGYTVDGVNPDFYFFPVYPTFMAALRLCHLPLYFVKIIQCIIATLTCLVIYHICKRAFNDKIGICAALLWSVYPYSVTHTQALEDSTLMVIFSTLGILASLVFVSKKTYLIAVFLGVICGISILIRSTFLSFMPFLFLWLLIYLKMKYLRHIMITAVTILLVVTPWFIRNYLHCGFITLGAHGGIGTWTGNNPYTNPLLKANLGPDYLIQREGYFITGNSNFEDITPEDDKIYYQRALNFIQDNPKVFVENVFLKLSYLCGWRYFYRQTYIPDSSYPYLSPPNIEELEALADEIYSQPIYRLRSIMYSFSFFPLFLTAVIGFFVSKPKSIPNQLILIFIISFTAVHLLSIVTIRNRQPIDALMTIYSAYFILWAINWLSDILKHRKDRSSR